MDNTLRYILYARKSTKRKDKQKDSLPDQIRDMTEHAKKLGLNVVLVLQETVSAKIPNKRPIFNHMIQMIEDGKADGILCWHINRLSRNARESGNLQWLLGEGIIKSIVTNGKEYLPADNNLLMSIETACSSQFSTDLSSVVLRRLIKKCDEGWYPGFLTQGYMNEKNTKTIVVDQERFDIIRELFEMVLKGCYSVTAITKYANDKYTYRFSRPGRESYGKLYPATLRNIFSNIFYTGHFIFQKKQYPGNHTPMISMEEYERVQEIITGKGKPRNTIEPFAFTGMIRCAECGCYITAEHKFKKQKTGEPKRHTYYHCSGKKGYCSQKKNYIREADMVDMIDSILAKVTISESMHSWAIKILKDAHKHEIDMQTSILKRLHKEETDLRNKKDSLLDLLLSKVITSEDYQVKFESTQKELTTVRQKLSSLNQVEDAWYTKIESVFDFLLTIRSRYLQGTPEDKREVFAALGQNFILKDKKLSIQMHEWLIAVSNPELVENTKKSRFEPGLDQCQINDNVVSSDEKTKWCAR